MSAYDWANLLTGRQNPYDELRDYEKRTALANATALSSNAAQGGVDPGIGPAGPPMGAPPGQPGGPAAPAAAPGPAPITTPDTTPPGQPQSYSTPKDLGSILVDLQQYNQNRADFDKALGGFASVFAQPINRERVMQSFEDSPAPDAGKFAQSLLELNAGQQNQDRLNALGRAINGPQGADLAKKLGMTPQQLQTEFLANPQGIGKLIEEQAATTPEQKNAAAATAEYAKSKGYDPDPTKWTPEQQQDVANYHSSILQSGLPGQSLDDQAYRNYAIAERQAGRTPLDPIAWKEHTQITTREKEAAINEYPKIDQKLTENEAIVNRLLANPKATLKALQAWLPTTGKYSTIPIIGPDQDVKDAARDLQTLKASLTGEGLSGVKNMRNQMEFATLGTAATGALDPNNDEATLRLGLQHLLDKFKTTRSIAQQQAGMAPTETPKAPADSAGGGGGGRKKYNPVTGQIE